MRRPSLLAPLLAAALPAAAQGVPLLSPSAEVRQTVASTTVTIDYHRPAVKGRTVWGGLVPFDQIWRAGANEATTITFSAPVKVEGHSVPMGRYALFSIPHRDYWTLILNRRAKQWGAWEYDPKEDVLRIEVKPKAVPHTEWLTYQVVPASPTTAYVDLLWERLRVSFLVEAEDMVLAKLRKTMAHAGRQDWKLYADAAEYGLLQQVPLDEALGWIDVSVAIERRYENLFLKAQLLQLAGDAANAARTAEQALALAKAHHTARSVTGPMEEFLGRVKGGGNGR